MHGRLVEYLSFKGLTQARLAELAGISSATVSRFCSGKPISSDNLLRILRVCDDLSLRWFFFGTGEMIFKGAGVTVNMGAGSAADFASGDGVMIKNSKGVNVGRGHDQRIYELLLEKEKLISERDAVISRLFEKLGKL